MLDSLRCVDLEDRDGRPTDGREVDIDLATIEVGSGLGAASRTGGPSGADRGPVPIAVSRLGVTLLEMPVR